MEERSDEEFFSTFIDMMRAAMPDKVITNFVFIAEVVSNDNNELSIVTSTGMTPWLAQGMLRAADDMIISGQHMYSDYAEDEEEEE
jgi:hypothetical protein